MKQGYYWVKYKGEWIIAEYMHDGIVYEWALIGTDDILAKSDFDEIDERRIERDQNPCWCKLDALALKNSGYIE